MFHDEYQENKFSFFQNLKKINFLSTLKQGTVDI